MMLRLKQKKALTPLVTTKESIMTLRKFAIDEISETGEHVACVGFSFTSRNLMENFYNCYTVQNEEGIVFCIDGTYKLVVNGWVLLAFGTDLCVQPRMGSAHSFIPFGFVFCKSESRLAFEVSISSHWEALKVFYALPEATMLNVICCVQDHSEAIR